MVRKPDLPSAAVVVLMMVLTALYRPSMSRKIRAICGKKNGPMDVHAETFDFKMLSKSLIFSGLERTSAFCDAWPMSVSHYENQSDGLMKQVNYITYSSIRH